MENKRIRPNKSWALFLDRDGVINEELTGSYVTRWEEFRFCEGSLEAMKGFAERFGWIFVVTNQRGVGKEIMSLEDLWDIHDRMCREINASGGRIDKIYSCTALQDSDRNRKPNVGMGLQAAEDFDELDFRRSIMVGNSRSDLEFGRRLGMHTVLITTKHAPEDLPRELYDAHYPSLLSLMQNFCAPELA